MSLKKQRDVSDIIHLFVSALSATDPVGIAIEPIALMSDPDNKTDGDYSLRVSYAVGGDENSMYISVFNCCLSMGIMTIMPENKLHQVLYSLLENAMKFKLSSRDKALHGGDDVLIIGEKGQNPDLGEALRQAAEMMAATKH